MKIGFLITRQENADKIVETAKAAQAKGHSVVIFMTDDGVYHVRNSAVTDLRNLENVEMSLCDYSANGRKIAESEIPAGVIKGTQYQNSVMHNECDKVLVF